MALGTDDTLASGVSTLRNTGNLEPARVVGGRYEILGLVGTGGMGSVYRARDVTLDETVALKLLKRELVDEPSMLARFRQEVKLARRVTHVNIARVFDIGEDGGDKFLTMEYVDGEPLSIALGRRGALPLDEVRAIARALCQGLAAAHAAGVVHRDLKPDNILLGGAGRVVITDFGIARAFLGGESGNRTQGGVFGTPAYMAPEQVEGAAVDARADLYAFGAVLFELTTGERAWRGDAVLAVAAARLTQPPPDPRARRPVPDPVAEVIVRLLARRPEDRFADANETARALEQAFDSVSRWTPLPEAPPRPLPPRGDKSVAVLPFKNAGPREDDYVAEGLTEDLVDTLSMTRGLRVRPHSVTARLSTGGEDARAIGRALDVQVLIEGSLRRVGERTRISARAIHVEDGFQIWAHRFDAAPGDLLVVSDGMAHAIAGALTAELATSRREGPSDPQAIELYLRARHEMRRTWNGDPRETLALLDKAVALAPHDGNLLATRALSLTRVAFRYGGADILAQALEAAQRAVEAAPDLGESWVALSNARMYRFERVAAAEAVREGIRRAPTAARLHELLGRLQLEVNLVDEAEAHLQAALRLDPGLLEVTEQLARLYAIRGEWDRADALLDEPTQDDAAFLGRLATRARLSMWRRRLIELPPAYPERSANHLVRALIELGRASQLAGAVSEEHTQLVSDSSSPDRPRLSAFLWQVHTELCGSLGDVPRALFGIERAIGHHLIDVTWLTRCPALAPARQAPEWPALLARAEANAGPIRAILTGL